MMDVEVSLTAALVLSALIVMAENVSAILWLPVTASLTNVDQSGMGAGTLIAPVRTRVSHALPLSTSLVSVSATQLLLV